MQLTVKADDIRDFEIEGISIGDSLLNHISKTQIDKLSKQFVYPNKQYYIFVIEKDYLNLNTYDYIQVEIKNNDFNYTVEALSGFLDYKNQIKDCHKKRKKIDSDIKESFKDLTIDKYNKKHRSDKTKKSINYITEFIFKNGDTIVTICEDWSSHMNHADSLRVGIVPKKFYDWISNEAYN
tara:strand:+ start:608 stop:1150 length:543 start_codon:yes stop_codon:yes gene_type:complete